MDNRLRMMIPPRNRAAAAEAEARAASHASQRNHSSGRKVKVALVAWVIFTSLFVREVVVPRLYLINHYGWARVQREGLSVVRVRQVSSGAVTSRSRRHQTHTYVISNGDQIRALRSQRTLLWLAAEVPILVVTGPIVWLLFRPKRSEDKGDAPGTQFDSPREPVE